MPADRLELLSHEIRPKYLQLAIDQGVRKGGYQSVVELPELSAVLHCRGYWNGIHKLVFRNVSHLGYTYCKNVAAEIFGQLANPTISAGRLVRGSGYSSSRPCALLSSWASAKLSDRSLPYWPNFLSELFYDTHRPSL